MFVCVCVVCEIERERRKGGEKETDERGVERSRRNERERGKGGGEIVEEKVCKERK